MSFGLLLTMDHQKENEGIPGPERPVALSAVSPSKTREDAAAIADAPAHRPLLRSMCSWGRTWYRLDGRCRSCAVPVSGLVTPAAIVSTARICNYGTIRSVSIHAAHDHIKRSNSVVNLNEKSPDASEPFSTVRESSQFYPLTPADRVVPVLTANVTR